MDTVADDLTSKTNAFQLKGSLFTLTSMQLFSDDLAIIRKQLTSQVQRSGDFFKNAPVIIELQKMGSDSSFSLFELTKLLREFNLIPVGVRGGSETQNQLALECGLAVLATPKVVAKEIPKKMASLTKSAKIVTRPVRSGQQIYAEGTDLIITSSVSAGAELLSDGHIHVYGTLRGRALAGIKGDKHARIFCKSLEAELVSIAGHYWVSEDMKAPFSRESVQVYLEEDRLRLGIL